MRVHAVTIAVQRSDQLYCSDGFEIGYVNDEKVRMTFSPACCDREAIAFAANTAGISGELMRVVMVQTRLERFGEGPQLPHAAEWLSDYGCGYSARENARPCGRLRNDPVPHTVALAAEQWHGRSLCQNLPPRLCRD
jgi:putative transposase